MSRPKLLDVAPLDDHILVLEFDSGEKRSFDVEPYMSGSWFGELRNTDYFRLVSVLPDGSGIEWPNGQDIAPHELYELSVAVA